MSCNSVFTPEEEAVIPIVAPLVKVGYFIIILSHSYLKLKS
jgi:hypothetical protein